MLENSVSACFRRLDEWNIERTKGVGLIINFGLILLKQLIKIKFFARVILPFS
jgi:hypothetical protein